MEGTADSAEASEVTMAAAGAAAVFPAAEAAEDNKAINYMSVCVSRDGSQWR